MFDHVDEKPTQSAGLARVLPYLEHLTQNCGFRGVTAKTTALGVDVKPAVELNALTGHEKMIFMASFGYVRDAVAQTVECLAAAPLLCRPDIEITLEIAARPGRITATAHADGVRLVSRRMALSSFDNRIERLLDRLAGLDKRVPPTPYRQFCVEDKRFNRLFDVWAPTHAAAAAKYAAIACTRANEWPFAPDTRVKAVFSARDPSDWGEEARWLVGARG